MKKEIQHFLDEGKIKEAAAFIKNAIKSGVSLESMNINLAHLLVIAGEWEEITTLLPKETNFFHTSGWLNSIKYNRPISGDNKPIPWFTYPAIDFLDGIVKNNWSIFEWGSGNSTLWWASKAEKVISIEDNQTWFMEVKNKLPQNSEIFFKTGNEYFDSILMYPDCSFDAIIIDGSHRNEATVNCVRKIKDQGIIVFDNSDAMAHEPAQRYLISRGFYRIDFWGLIPSYLYKNCTSVYFNDAGILKQKQSPTVHRSSVGISCQQSIDRIREITQNVSSVKDNYTEENISERHPICKKKSSMHKYPDVKTAAFLLSQREAYRPVMFSVNEVFCSPDCVSKTIGGIVKTIQTHGGVFDIKQAIDQMPWSQKPELIVVKTDATGRNFPINLQQYHCPKLLILGDTHHLNLPIQTLLVYAAQEKFDYIISDHDRHHLHLFKEAGFDNVFWIPCYNVYPHEQPVFEDKIHDVSFVGQVGRWHPYRKYVIQFLQANGIPVQVIQAPHEKAAEIYAKSLINLNISLNGDFNLRVFEVLSSGGFLLADRLSQESGLEMIFKDGEHLVCYDSPQDLLEKIRYYLNHPSEAKSIAHKGYEEYKRHHTPEIKSNELMDIILKGRLKPLYEIQKDRRSIYLKSSSKEDLFHRIATYEFFQKVHLKNQEPAALFFPSVDPRVLCDISDLPRLRLYIKDNGTDIPDANRRLYNDTGISDRIHTISSEDIKKIQDGWDIVVMTASDLVDQNLEEFLISMNFKLLVVSDSLSSIDEERRVKLMEYFSANGFEKIHENPDVFFWKDKSFWGEYLFSKGLTVEAVKNFERALRDNPANENALNNLGVISYQLNQYDAAENFLLKAVSLNRRNVNSLNNLVQLYMTMERFEEAAGLLREITGMNPEQPEPWYLLGICQERLNLLDDAFDAFKKAEKFDGKAYPMPEGVHTKIEESLFEKNDSQSRISSKNILVINNLYPPQELGGYGRLLFDFTNILRKRGHSIYVLTSDTPYLGKTEGDAPDVDRSLVLFGGWEGGVCKAMENRDDIIQIVRKNIAGLEQVLKVFRPDACLLGNIDFLSKNILDPILDKKIPIIHHLGNQNPSYAVHETPKSRHYHLATASRWLKKEIQKQGYLLKDISVIYPGALIKEFRMRVPPALDKLRIAYASIVLPYKGPHILINALKKLHDSGIDFSCSIAGTSTDQDFVDYLKSFVAETGMEEKILFLGFLTREDLKNLFACHNVLVFPSIVKEAFGISQVEAMAAGLTVVSSGTGGAKEIVEHGVSGIIFKTEDEGSLAAELIQLVNDIPRWQQIALAGQRRAIEEFDIERSVDALESGFDRLLHNK
jgi:glycosyltransferase involved in cell wall biosynthesis